MCGRKRCGILCSSFICFGLMCLGFSAVAFAQGVDEAAATSRSEGGTEGTEIEGVAPSIQRLLFVGTATNLNDPAATANDVFAVDQTTDMSFSILTGVQVWGATADTVGLRVLFTRASGLTPPAGEIGGGDELFSLSFAGGTPISLGRIVNGAGDGFRIDGLALSGGVLYGVNAGAGVDNGFYTIDLTTFLATAVSLFADSISGLDADPSTGIIYGTNDTTGQLVTISPAGVITNVAAYPAGVTDVDGLAVGEDFAYLVTDEGGTFPVFSLSGGAFVTPLTSPFAVADTFSGAALTIGVGIFSDGFESGNTDAWSSVTGLLDP